MRFVARRVSLFVVMAAVMFSAGCSKDKPGQGQGQEQGPRNESDLQVLKLRPGVPPLEQTSASFYAKSGEAREVALYFTDGSGGRGSLYFRLRLGANTLLTGPDGKPVAPGDSVLITVKLPDPNVLLFDLEPSGLRFSGTDPAELVISYAEADQDFNGDGKREKDQKDQEIERRLGIWRQEAPGKPFERLKSRLDEQLDQVTAPLDGFTRFAMSY